DLDVEILRRDWPEVARALAGWDLRSARGGALFPIPQGHAPPEEVNSVWARPRSDGPWVVELLLGGSRTDRWIFRRNPAVSLPIRDLGLTTTDDIPYLVPEVVLLFKSKDPR